MLGFNSKQILFHSNFCIARKNVFQDRKRPKLSLQSKFLAALAKEAKQVVEDAFAELFETHDCIEKIVFNVEAASASNEGYFNIEDFHTSYDETMAKEKIKKAKYDVIEHEKSNQAY